MTGFQQPPRQGLSASDAILRAGKQLADPNYWTQGALARSSTGVEVEPCVRRAVRWSLDGIMYWVHGVKTDDYDAPTFNKMANDSALIAICSSRLYRKTPTQLNDQNDPEVAHRQVLEVLRASLRRARGTEAQKRELELAQ